MANNSRPLVPVNTKGLDDVASALLNNPSNPPEQQNANNINVQTNTAFWTIGGVEYKNGIYFVDLARQLLDNGNTKTQDDWVAYSLQAQKKGEFYTPNYQILHGTFKALFKGRNGAKKNEVEEARAFLEKESKARWLMTLTRMQYKSSGLDVVVHNYGMPDKFEVRQDFVGPDGFIKDVNASGACKALLNSDNVAEINSIYKWLGSNQNGAYLFRVNSKTDTERVARFYANSDRANLYCYWNPTSTNSSLGVRIRKKN